MAELKMPEINTVIIAGNLTKDPVFKTTSNGNTLVTFTIATNRRYRDSNNQWQEEVCFVGVVARNKLAESCRDRLSKGSAVLIEGELQSRNWKTETGNSFRVVEIKARRIQFLSKVFLNNEGTEPDVISADEDSDGADRIPGAGTSSPPAPDHESDHPVSFRDTSLKEFISNEESELLKRNNSDS